MPLRYPYLHRGRRAPSHGWPPHAPLLCHACVHAAAHARYVAARDARACYGHVAHGPSAGYAPRHERPVSLDGVRHWCFLGVRLTRRDAGDAAPLVTHSASTKVQGREAQRYLRNDEDKGEDSACPRAGTRRMPEVFMVAPHAALAKCPVGYVRSSKPVKLRIRSDNPPFVVVMATNRKLPRRPRPPRGLVHPTPR